MKVKVSGSIYKKVKIFLVICLTWEKNANFKNAIHTFLSLTFFLIK